MAIVKMASTILAPLVLLLICPNGITLPGEFTVELFVGGRLAIDETQELQPCLMTMTLHAGGHHTAVEGVESGKQRGGSMPLVIMRHRMGTALFHGQTGLSTVKSLDLALLVQ